MSMALPDYARRVSSNIAIERLKLTFWDPPSPEEGGAPCAAFSVLGHR